MVNGSAYWNKHKWLNDMNKDQLKSWKLMACMMLKLNCKHPYIKNTVIKDKVVHQQWIKKMFIVQEPVNFSIWVWVSLNVNDTDIVVVKKTNSDIISTPHFVTT